MKKWLFLIVMLYGSGGVNAQIQLSTGSKSPFGQRIYFGGNLGLQFGNITYIDLSPLAGYMITSNLSAGVGITYRYLEYKNIHYKTNIYGGRVFARNNLTFLRLPLFLYGEYENLNLEFARYTTPTDYYITREWVPSIFLGGGLFQPFGRRGGFMLMALYNIIYDAQRSPYNSPLVIRVGFTL